VQHFINSGGHPVSLDKNVIKKLEEYDWPGNVRELKNWVDRIARRFAKNHLEWNDIPERYIPSRLADESTEDDYSPELPFDIKKFEEMIRLSALEKAEGNASEADRLLNLKPGTMKAWRHKRKQKSKIS
jgi:DNA-binding NtrC family response regulator